MSCFTRLIYTSRAVEEVDFQALAKISRQAEFNNALKDVTGILISGSGYFLQLLEGESEAVDEIYHSRITRDPRHTDFCVLLREDTGRRLFPDWSIGPIQLHPNPEASRGEWEAMCRRMKSEFSGRQDDEDAAIHCIDQFIKAFGDERDHHAFQPWSNSLAQKLRAS